MIKFIKITSTQFAQITPNGDYFYLLTDTNEVYLGSRHLTDQDLSAYLTSVSAKDNSIVVSNNSQIGVKLSSKTGNALSVQTGSGEEGLYVNVPSQTDYSISITETSGGAQDPYSKRYRVQQAASSTDVNIDIPKDMVVESGSVVDITYNSTDGKLYDGATDVTSKIKGTGTATAADAGKYIKLTIANSTSDVIYIAAKDLVDIYTVEANAEKIQLAIDSNNEISADVVAGSIELADLDSDVQTSLGKADSAIQSVATGSTNGTIAVDGTDVSVYGLGSAAYTASTAYDAAGAASGVQTALIGTASDTASSDTIKGAKKYADSLASNYATAAQGAKADTAIQSVTTGTTNGTIKVDGNAVSVYGLDSAAYAATTDFDAAGAAAAVLGSNSDIASSNTVYGAKAYADSLLEWETYSAE